MIGIKERVLCFFISLFLVFKGFYIHSPVLSLFSFRCFEDSVSIISFFNDPIAFCDPLNELKFFFFFFEMGFLFVVLAVLELAL